MYNMSIREPQSVCLKRKKKACQRLLYIRVVERTFVNSSFTYCNLLVVVGPIYTHNF